MVLEIKVPHSADWHALQELAPKFISYIISFAYVGIYWNNHHHLLQTAKQINPGIMWGNLNLLFWLSLVPFGTAWMGENNFETVPVAFYSGILLICGYSYNILQKCIIAHHKDDSAIRHALLKHNAKGWVSTICYALAIPAAFLHTAISMALIIFVAILWFIPSKEIEKSVTE
jgi:uncharacterized membrane protein